MIRRKDQSNWKEWEEHAPTESNTHFDNNIKFFYKDFNEEEIKNISIERALELRKLAKAIEYRRYNPKSSDYKGFGKLSNTADHLRMRSEKYGINSTAEQHLVFMLHIDPTFEGLKIFYEAKTKEELRQKCSTKFGIDDNNFLKNLLKTEKIFAIKFMSIDERKELDREIIKRKLQR